MTKKRKAEPTKRSKTLEYLFDKMPKSERRKKRIKLEIADQPVMVTKNAADDGTPRDERPDDDFEIAPAVEMAAKKKKKKYKR